MQVLAEKYPDNAPIIKVSKKLSRLSCNFDINPKLCKQVLLDGQIPESDIPNFVINATNKIDYCAEIDANVDSDSGGCYDTKTKQINLFVFDIMLRYLEYNQTIGKDYEDTISSAASVILLHELNHAICDYHQPMEPYQEKKSRPCITAGIGAIAMVATMHFTKGDGASSVLAAANVGMAGYAAHKILQKKAVKKEKSQRKEYEDDAKAFSKENLHAYPGLVKIQMLEPQI